MKKLEISRAFSMKVQVKQYEPVEFFCAAKAELEEGETSSQVSASLDALCQKEVAISHRQFMERLRQAETPNPRMREKGSQDAGFDAGMTGEV